MSPKETDIQVSFNYMFYKMYLVLDINEILWFNFLFSGDVFPSQIHIPWVTFQMPYQTMMVLDGNLFSYNACKWKWM